MGEPPPGYLYTSPWVLPESGQKTTPPPPIHVCPQSDAPVSETVPFRVAVVPLKLYR